jgi:hypothetical protein
VTAFAFSFRVFFGSIRSGAAAEMDVPGGITKSSLGRQVAARCSGFFRNFRYGFFSTVPDSMSLKTVSE